MTLDEIALKHGTDKSSAGHNYTPIYEGLFGALRGEPVGLLELGVEAGNSLRMWADYFTHPQTRIAGIDCGPGALFLPDRVVKYHGDQAEVPAELVGWAPDIVIDDASHLSSKTIASFRVWWPVLKPGGVYVVEDVQTSYNTAYSGQHEAHEDPDRPPAAHPKGQTAMQFLRRLADEVQSFAVKPAYRLGFGIESLCFHNDLVVARKQSGERRYGAAWVSADHRSVGDVNALPSFGLVGGSDAVSYGSLNR